MEELSEKWGHTGPMKRKVSEVPVLPLGGSVRVQSFKATSLASKPAWTDCLSAVREGERERAGAHQSLGSPLPTQSPHLTQLKELGSEKKGLAQGQLTRM